MYPRMRARASHPAATATAAASASWQDNQRATIEHGTGSTAAKLAFKHASCA